MPTRFSSLILLVFPTYMSVQVPPSALKGNGFDVIYNKHPAYLLKLFINNLSINLDIKVYEFLYG